MSAVSTLLITAVLGQSNMWTFQRVAGVKCLDGTEGGYYYRDVPPGGGDEVISIGLMGSEGCGLPGLPDCRTFLPTTLGSAKGMDVLTNEETLPGYSADMFSHFSYYNRKVWIPQCSGDHTLGTMSEPGVLHQRLQHSGADNLMLIAAAIKSQYSHLGVLTRYFGGIPLLSHCAALQTVLRTGLCKIVKEWTSDRFPSQLIDKMITTWQIRSPVILGNNGNEIIFENIIQSLQQARFVTQVVEVATLPPKNSVNTTKPFNSPQLDRVSPITEFDYVSKTDKEWIGYLVSSIVLFVVGFTIIPVTSCVRKSSYDDASYSPGIIVLYVIGLVLVCVALAIYGIIPFAISNGIRDIVVLDKTDAKQLDQFTTTMRNDSFLYWREYYAFNVTNPDDIRNGRAKPIVKSVGPFVYRYYKEKHNVTFTPDDKEVHYQDWNYYEFDEERSVGPESMEFVTFNSAYHFVMQQMARGFGVRGEDELEVMAPALFIDLVVQQVGLPFVSSMWGTNPAIDTIMAQTLNIPQLPLFFGFATYTTTASKSMLTISPSDTSRFLTTVTGSTPDKLHLFKQMFTMLESASTCFSKLGGGNPACVIISLKLQEIDAIFSSWDIILEMYKYINQLVRDGQNGPGSRSVLSLLSTSKSGVVERLFVKRSAREIWFDNNDPLYVQLQKKPFIGMMFQWPNVTAALPIIASQTTIEGTGKDDWRKTSYVYREDGLSTLDYWARPYPLSRPTKRYNTAPSYNLNGVPDTPDRVTLWVDLIWRNVNFNFAASEKHKGIDMNRYYLDNGVISEDDMFLNKHFGFINCQTTIFDWPLLYSAPHMSYANRGPYRDMIEGLEPIDDDTLKLFDSSFNNSHATSLWFEPVTGALVKFRKRLQFNTIFNDIGGYQFPNQYPRLDINSELGVIFPIFIIDEHGELTDDQADDIKSLIYTPLKIRKAVIIVGGWVLGPTLMIVAIAVVIKQSTSLKKKDENGSPSKPIIVQRRKSVMPPPTEMMKYMTEVETDSTTSSSEDVRTAEAMSASTITGTGVLLQLRSGEQSAEGTTDPRSPITVSP